MDRLDEHTIESGFLPIGHGHEMFFEVWGNADAPTILFFHGGPGYGYTTADKTLFNPHHCRVIFYDQRGAGKSKFEDPFKGNKTENLLLDIEVLREHLDLDRCILVGGSWGSTLALLYAMNYPHLVSSVVLRAFFPANKKCINALTDQANAMIIPEAYLKFVNLVPRSRRKNLIAYYADELKSGDSGHRLTLAKAWHDLAIKLGRIPDPPEMDESSILHAAITAHFAHHKCFLPDNYLFANAQRMEGIPIEIIHGTRDLLCPIEYARQLDEKLDDVNLIEVEAGHSAFEENMFTAVRDSIGRAIERVIQSA